MLGRASNTEIYRPLENHSKVCELLRPSDPNSCHFRGRVHPVAVSLSVLRGAGTEDPDLQRAHLLRKPQLLQGGDEQAAGPDAGEDPQPGEGPESPGEAGEGRHRQHRGRPSAVAE